MGVRDEGVRDEWVRDDGVTGSDGVTGVRDRD